jgi:outer membrane protein assembly factor BamC
VKKIQLTLNLLVLFSLSACGIKNYFPDKSKEYQFTAEIPELVIPADLTANTIVKPLDKTVIAPEITPLVEQQIDTEIEEPVVPHFYSDEEAIVDDSIKTKMFVELGETTEGTVQIRMGDTLARSWRIVGKVLTRHAIEITKRNEQEGIFSLQYDPDFKPVEDGSIWDEVLFIFGSDPTNEQEFKIKMAAEADGKVTEIFVLDSNDQPLSEGTGLKLLTLIYQTIKDDLVQLKL